MYTLLIYLFSESIFFHFENLYQNSNFHLNYLAYIVDNLIKNKKLYYIQETINIDFDNYDSNIFIVSCVIENRSTSFTYLPFSFVFLKNNDYSMREIGHINNVTRGVSLTISNNIATITGDSTTAKLMSVVILAL